MSRKLRAFGRTLSVVLAVSALTAASAQAEQGADFWAQSQPSTIDIVNNGLITWTAPGLPLTTCTELKGHAVLAEENSALTATDIQLNGCHVVTLGITFPVTIDTNGCHFTFTTHTYTPDATEGAGAADGDVHIEGCDDGGITETIFKAGSAGHSEADLRCTIHIPNQTPGEATEVTYLNETTEGTMAILGEAHLDTLQTTITSSTICGSERTVQATFDFAFWLKATDEGNYVDMTVTGTGA